MRAVEPPLPCDASQFDYALLRKGRKKMIAVVMEKACCNPRDWTGTVGGKLGTTLYVNLTGDDDTNFNGGAQRRARAYHTASKRWLIVWMRVCLRTGVNHLVNEINTITRDDKIEPQATATPGAAQASAAGPSSSRAEASSSSSLAAGAIASASPAAAPAPDAAHGAPVRLRSEPDLVSAREQAISIGLVTLLEKAGVDASPAQLAKGASFCSSEGASSVEELAKYGKTDGLVESLELKSVPKAKLQEALVSLAPESTPAPAAKAGCCCILS